MCKGQEETFLEQPALMCSQVVLQVGKVAGAKRLAYWKEHLLEVLRLWAREQDLRRESAEENVTRDEVGENVVAMRLELRRCLEVGLLKA
jgi:hypothetical protein